MHYKDEHITNETIRIYFDIKNNQSSIVKPEQKEIIDSIDKHLQSCPKCSTHLYMVESLYNSEVKKYTYRNKIRKNLVYSASIILIAISIFYFQPWNKDQTEIPLIAKDDLIDSSSTDKNSLKNLIEDYIALKANGNESNLLSFSNERELELPPSYIEDRFQERQVKESNIRSTVSKIRIISPKNLTIILKSPLTFTWENFDGEVVIVIKDNRNTIIWEGTSSTKPSLTCYKKLEPGTYYWDLRIKARVIFKRKFFIISE